MHQRQKLVRGRFLNERNERFIFAIIQLLINLESQRPRSEPHILSSSEPYTRDHHALSDLR